jgi:hypothetical protein
VVQNVSSVACSWFKHPAVTAGLSFVKYSEKKIKKFL